MRDHADIAVKILAKSLRNSKIQVKVNYSVKLCLIKCPNKMEEDDSKDSKETLVLRK